MDVKHYLERIHYHGAPQRDLATLHALQRAHLHALPFENLSIHYRQPVILEQEGLFRKLIHNRRGGMCYELNGLFAGLLRELGFDVTLIAAEVAAPHGVFGPAFDHMALLVQLDEVYLVDVGFGDSFQAPLRLGARGEQDQGEAAYRIDVEGDYHVLSRTPQRRSRGDPASAMQVQYRFTPTPRALADFKPMCDYHQSSPASHFTQKRICSRATALGRVSISDMRLIITRKGVREESALASEAQFLRAIEEHCGICLEAI